MLLAEIIVAAFGKSPARSEIDPYPIICDVTMRKLENPRVATLGTSEKASASCQPGQCFVNTWFRNSTGERIIDFTHHEIGLANAMPRKPSDVWYASMYALVPLTTQPKSDAAMNGAAIFCACRELFI